MTASLTIRLPLPQRRLLRAHAAASGKTESELVRDLIAARLGPGSTVAERAGRYFGRLDFDPAGLDADPWRAHLRRSNIRA